MRWFLTMTKREKIFAGVVVLLLGLLIYLLCRQPTGLTTTRLSVPIQSLSKQYRIEYNYPSEIRVILLGTFPDEESIKRVGREAALEVARKASKDGYTQESVSYEVATGVFVLYNDGTEKIFPDIKIYRIRKKN